jgi:hypothetical protein
VTETEGEAERTEKADRADTLSKDVDAAEQAHGVGTLLDLLNAAKLEDKGNPVVEGTEGIFFFSISCFFLHVYCFPRRSVCVSASAFLVSNI